MNILYVNHYDRSNDSASISSYEIIRGLASIGHNVTVITNDPYASNQDLRGQRFRRFVLPFPRAIEESRFLRFLRCTIAYVIILLAGLRLGKREKIDCIFSQHHNFHFATLTAYVLCSFLHVPHVVKVQDGVPLAEPWVEGPIERVHNVYVMRILNGLALQRARYILAQSRELKKLLTKIFKIHSRQVLIVPNSVSAFSVEPARIEEMRKKLGLQNEKILVFVGVARGREVDALIKALPRIVSEGLDAKLVIVGYSPNALRSLAAALEVEKRVTFTGTVPHDLVPVPISMSNVAIGPLASDLATIGAVPRKVLEYMACGKPVICSRGSVSQDLLIDGYNGILIEPGDIDGLALAVIDLMKDEKLASELGRNAQKHILKFYSEELLANKLTKLMNDIS